MERKELDEIIKAIRDETHEAIKNTGHTWIEAAVRKITPVVMDETLTRLGVQLVPPFDMQKDFAFLRQSRIDSENTRKTIRKTLTSYCINGAISLIIAGGASWVIVKQVVANSAGP